MSIVQQQTQHKNVEDNITVLCITSILIVRFDDTKMRKKRNALNAIATLFSVYFWGRGI